MRINWKKTFIVASDMLIGTYLILAFTAFNKPDETVRLCTKVNINIQDEATNGFINTREIKERLEKTHLYPLEKPMKYVDLRKMEETLTASPFVKTAQCYKTQCEHCVDPANACCQNQSRQWRRLLSGRQRLHHAQFALHFRPDHCHRKHQQAVCHRIYIAFKQGVDVSRTVA